MHYLRRGVAIVLIFLTVSAQAVQNPVQDGGRSQARVPSGTQAKRDARTTEPDLQWLQDILADHELLAEIGAIAGKLQTGVHYPASRNQSHILPRLSDSTVFYGAFPNYGETMHEAVQIFNQELKHSPHLQAFLEKNQMAEAETKLEAFLEKLYGISQFLGDEVVIVGHWQGHEPSGVLVAEIKKPGLREFLKKWNSEAFQADRLLLLDPQQLAAADPDDRHTPPVLIRPDLVAVGSDITSLRAFNSQIDEAGSKFASSRLGDRVAQAYKSGTSSVVGVDLRKIIATIPRGRQQEQLVLEKTGLTDVDYLIMQNSISAKGSANEGEVVFSRPRRGIASWLAEPGTMGGLDFVSVHAASAGDLILKNPAQIFDDLQDIAGESAFAGLRQMEMQLNLSLKYDLLSKLGGEIAFETKAPLTPAGATVKTTFSETEAPKINPGAFKLILRVTDATGFQQTLSKLLATAPVEAKERQEAGVTFHSLALPTPTDPPMEINYFFMDGYMVIASDRATAREALDTHRDGRSLAKSAAVRESLAQARSGHASAVFYQDPSQTIAAMMARLPAEMRNLLPADSALMSKPNVFSVEAEESSFRAFTKSDVAADASVALIVAAIAIPSLMRSRASANDAVAASTVRTVNTAEIAYFSSYPDKGFAPNLAALGSGGRDCAVQANVTADHACLLDKALTDNCTSGKWCEKSGYKFGLRGVCLQGQCPNYVVTAVPASPQAGSKSYCSTSDGVVRTNSGAPPATPLTVAECKRWAPVR
jgi:hypothetical protein